MHILPTFAVVQLLSFTAAIGATSDLTFNREAELIDDPQILHRTKRFDPWDAVGMGIRLLKESWPTVKEIIEYFANRMWNAASVEDKLINRIETTVGQLHQRIDETRIEEAQKVLEGAFRRYEFLYSRVVDDPYNTALQAMAAMELHGVRSACDRILAQLETMTETRKFALVSTSVNAIMCLSAAKTHYSNVTLLYSPGQHEVMRHTIRRYIRESIDRFAKLGVSILREWSLWRYKSFEISFTKKFDWGCVCWLTYANLKDKASTRGYTRAGMCRDYFKNKVIICTKSVVNKIHAKALDEYSKFRDVITRWRLQRFLPDPWAPRLFTVQREEMPVRRLIFDENDFLSLIVRDEAVIMSNDTDIWEFGQNETVTVLP